MVADFGISILVSPDAMTAVLELSGGPRGLFSRGRLAEAVAAAGLSAYVDDLALDEIMAAHAQGQEISGRVIAKGRPPEPPRHRTLEVAGQAAFPVFPGDMFAEVKPGWPGTPGKNLRGEIIEPEAPRALPLPQLSPDSGVARVGDQYFALRHGLARLEENRIFIEELFRLSPDGLELRGAVYPRDFSGKAVTVQRIREAMLAMQITLPPCLFFLQRSLREAEASGVATADVLVACAVGPRPGQDGYLDLHVRDKRSQAGFTDARGRIDYRQRGRLPTVEKGALVATYVEPTQGHPGRTLDNRYLPTEPGRELRIKPGANIRLAEDQHSYYAQTDGLLLLQDDELAVSEVYYVRNDVDMRIGHVEMDRGSIHVKGSVLAGFRLSCPGSIVVEGTVEDAKITAGGDVEIAGGLVMAGGGLVRAGGNVISLFASKARIDAEGDISVINELINCHVLADGKVTVTGGNSKIIGGVIQAGESISALEVGTALGSRTIIHLGLDEGFLYKKRQEAARLRAALRKLEAQLGGGDLAETPGRLTQEKQGEIARLLHSRGLLLGRLKRLEERLARCEDKIARDEGCVLKVLGAIHPGTVIHCRGKNMSIRSPLEFSQITFDSKRKQFRVSQLQAGSGGRNLN